MEGLSERLFNHDMGPVTKEELDDWMYNISHPDRDDEDYKYRGGFGKQIMVTQKLSQSLPMKEFEMFGNLLEKRARFPNYFTPSEQTMLQSFEDKILSSSKTNRENILKEHANERMENHIPEGQPVREKGTGRVGAVFSGSFGDPTGKGDFMIYFDDGGLPTNVPRDNLEILCNKCGIAPGRRCTRCKQAWYCGRDCQVKDWKTHKKVCKKESQK